MTSKHTPGPWMVGETLRAESLAVIGDGDSVVCEFPCRLGAAVDADARLIAAAPELLEALEELAAWVNRAIVPEYGLRKPMPENCRKALEASAAAIAKATGEQP